MAQIIDSESKMFTDINSGAILHADIKLTLQLTPEEMKSFEDFMKLKEIISENPNS